MLERDVFGTVLLSANSATLSGVAHLTRSSAKGFGIETMLRKMEVWIGSGKVSSVESLNLFSLRELKAITTSLRLLRYRTGTICCMRYSIWSLEACCTIYEGFDYITMLH